MDVSPNVVFKFVSIILSLDNKIIGKMPCFVYMTVLEPSIMAW